MYITVIGAGSYGRALAKILQLNRHSIQFFDPYKFPTVRLESALASTDAIILVAPSLVAADLLRRIPVKHRSLPLICATKGFLNFDLIKNYPHFSVISGPIFASDLEHIFSSPYNTANTLYKPSLKFTTTSSLSGRLLNHSRLKFETTTDTTGVLLCGAIKNLFAVYSGLRLFAANPGGKAFTDFITTAHRETKLILTALNADPNTATLSCGLDDLILTCASPKSRNYQLGAAITTETLNAYLSNHPTVESINIVENHKELLKAAETPMLHGIIDLISSLRLPYNT